jgi:DNA recombination protein RmuC
MIPILLFANLAAVASLCVIALLLWRKQGAAINRGDLSQIVGRFDEQQRSLGSTQSMLRDEFALNRSEAAAAFRALREEVAGNIGSVSNSNEQKLELLRQGMDQKIAGFQEEIGSRVASVGAGVTLASKSLTEALGTQLNELRQTLADMVLQTYKNQKDHTESLAGSFDALSTRLQQAHSRLADVVEAKFNGFQHTADTKLQQVRTDFANNAQELRDDTRQTLANFGDSVRTNILEMTQFQKTESEQLRSVVDQRLHTLQVENEQKLEQMRQTVDEKLQGTLEARLGESFKQVSDRLDQVHRGLGEMQSLATGVGDLKKVLTNVKSRGIWGEIQLGNLLEQTLAPEQFERNVSTTGTNERVEYAIKLPGGSGSDSHVWLPIDSKFPLEDYQRLVEASERGDVEAMEFAARQLESVLKNCAKDIKEKYLAPPATTDFGVLFLPTESLYAEAIRRTGLAEYVQREHRVIFAGPTTLSALLSSLRMGFRTLAIQQRTTEVWDLLGAVKNEFGKYADLLGKVKKKLEQAGNSIDDAERRTRAIHRKLRSVEAPQMKTTPMLLTAAISSAGNDVEDEDPADLEAIA